MEEDQHGHMEKNRRKRKERKKQEEGWTAQEECGKRRVYILLAAQLSLLCVLPSCQPQRPHRCPYYGNKLPS